MNLNNKHTIKPLLKTFGLVVYIMFLSLLIILFFAERWLFNTWAELNADEILYHMKSSIDGTNPEMIKDAIINYGIWAFIIIVIIIAGFIFFSKNKNWFRLIFMFTMVFALSIFAFLKYDLDRRINFTNYIIRSINGTDMDYIKDNYVDSKTVDLSFPKRKRNLIYIYLESLEMTYADKESGGAFDVNVIPELTKLAQDNEDFSGDSRGLNGGISLPGTNWTMAAMFAMSTGLPLKIDLGGNGMQNQESFFPEIEAIGDILEVEGYNQELLIGSNAKFGGRNIFYQGHGNYQISDYTYAKKVERIPEDYKVFWGYEDEKLFEYAKEDLLKLSDQSEPFNLTMLTVDTHFEDGNKCRLCRDDYQAVFNEQYADVMACSSRQVTEFIHWIQQQDFYENTSIIICGDHPTMDRTFCVDVPNSYQRKFYVAIINADDEVELADKRREYSSFDLFPTTLAALGVEIPGNQLGLGVNLYSDKETLIEKYGVEQCKNELEYPSEFMKQMSGIRITEESLRPISDKAKIKMKKGKDGKVTLSLKKVNKFINKDSIKKITLELTDKKTGKTTEYETELILNKRDPNSLSYNVTLDLQGKSLNDFLGNYYIYVDDIEHYKIADFLNNLSGHR